MGGDRCIRSSFNESHNVALSTLSGVITGFLFLISNKQLPIMKLKINEKKDKTIIENYHQTH